MRYFRQRALTLAQQHAALVSSRTAAGHGRVGKGLLTWEFEASPTPLSRNYRLRIRYRHGGTPEVVVIAPDLNELANGRDLPHVYEQDPPRLCLYLPRAGEWSPDQSLVKTIVPWSILWLYYFEDWLATGDWKGGGEHPKVKGDGAEKTDPGHRRRRD